MTDRQLLEDAARAAGMVVWRGKGHQSDMLFTNAPAHESGLMTGIAWRPLEDSGQALELAVKLRIDLTLLNNLVQAQAGRGPIATEVIYETTDPMAATRRAIVRAAAALAPKE